MEKTSLSKPNGITVDGQDEWLTRAEAAHRLGVSQRGIYRLVAEGAIQKIQRRVPGRQSIRLFSAEDVARLLAGKAQADALVACAAKTEETIPLQRRIAGLERLVGQLTFENRELRLKLSRSPEGC